VPYFPVLHIPPLHFRWSRIFQSCIFSRPARFWVMGEKNRQQTMTFVPDNSSRLHWSWLRVICLSVRVCPNGHSRNFAHRHTPLAGKHTIRHDSDVVIITISSVTDLHSVTPSIHPSLHTLPQTLPFSGDQPPQYPAWCLAAEQLARRQWMTPLITWLTGY